MVAVGELAISKGKWKKEDSKRQKDLIEKAGLPTNWPNLDLESVYKIIEGDKKVINEKIRFIVPTKIGAVEISNDINKQDIKACLQRLTK